MLDLMINKMLERMKYNLGTRKDLNSKNHNERQLAATTIDRGKFTGTGNTAWSETGPMDPMGSSHYGTTPTEWETS